MNGGANQNQTNTNDTSICVNWLSPWYLPDSRPLEDFPFLTLQLQLVVVYIINNCLHHIIFKHFGIPRLASQLTAGILLSPKAFIYRVEILRKIYDIIFPKTSEEVWDCMAMLGYALSMFIVAVKTDFTIITKTGRKAIAFALLALVIPIIMNVIVTSVYGNSVNLDPKDMSELQAGSVLMGLIPFPVIAILLSEMQLLNSELGRLASSMAIIGEASSIFIMTGANAFAKTATRNNLGVTALLFGRFILVIVVLVLLMAALRPYMYSIIEHTPKGRPVQYRYLILVFLVMLVGAIVTNVNGQFVLLGSFIAGAALPEGPPLGSTLINKFDFFVMELLLPLFITTSSMNFNLLASNSENKLRHGLLLITLSSFSTRILVCLACGLYSSMTVSDALALGFIIASKGMVEIGSFTIMHNSGVFSDYSFSYYVVLITIVSVLFPVAIKTLYHPLRKYAGYQVRDILHCKEDANLRILVCISSAGTVSSFTQLLGLTNPASKQTIVDVLHLIKLVGRSQPIFISHDLQKSYVANTMSYSEDVIWDFNRFLKSNTQAFSLHFYTAVSPRKAMHDDICFLALDKLASLIILPFHRKMRIDGSIDSEDHDQRVLNNSILERAPCSVGILVDRGSYRRRSTKGSKNLTSVVVHQPQDNEVLHVGVIFIGGKDDQEAVAYAKRMATGFMVKVHVIRLVSARNDCELSLLDYSTLSVFQDYSNSANKSKFKYMEKVLNDGPETAKLLRSIVGDYDLIIVGRRFGLDCSLTSGLSEWSEVPELGILGDLLASPDLPCRTSILVIQQQKK